MPPARTIFADTELMLRNILEQQKDQQADARRHYADPLLPKFLVRQKIEEASWVPRDLNALAGRMLTDSERKRHQEAVRQLVADGLVETFTVWIRLTLKGQRHVQVSKRAAKKGTPDG